MGWPVNRKQSRLVDVVDELTPQEAAELKQDLLALRIALAEQLEASKDSARPVDLDHPFGRVSRIDAIQHQSVAKANRHRSTVRLDQVRAALAAVDEGEYGFCRLCEEPIGFGRLKARPEAPFCHTCQDRRESRR